MKWTCFFYILFVSGGLFAVSAFSMSSFDFKILVQRYAENSGVKMHFKKRTYLKLLDKTKISFGEIFLSKGAFNLKVKDALKTQFVFDGKHLWYITSPREEQKQIVKLDTKTSHKSKLLFSFLFRPDLLFQNFRFISSRQKGRTWILSFEPVNIKSEIQSFSVKVDGKRILQVWIKWKNLGNEEEYTFSNIQFNQNIPSRFFHISKK